MPDEKTELKKETPSTNKTPLSWKNIILNFPFWLHQAARHQAMFRIAQIKIFFLVRFAKTRRWVWHKKWVCQMYIAGYRWIKPERFMTEFPPNPKHKMCHGKGYFVVQLPNKMKAIRWCTCIHDKYKASGKKYIIKET